LPQEATEQETTRLSRMLRRLLDEVDKEDKQESSMDVGCLLTRLYLQSPSSIHCDVSCPIPRQYMDLVIKILVHILLYNAVLTAVITAGYISPCS